MGCQLCKRRQTGNTQTQGAAATQEVDSVRVFVDPIDNKPAKISAVNLAGDTLALLELSVNATAGDIEKGICRVANIDGAEFALTITYEGVILDKTQKLHEAGILPEQSALVSVVKSKQKKRIQNPVLDRALFQEAWTGGGSADRVQALLEQNADPNGYTFSDGDCAIHVTAGRGCVEVVRLLLEARADIKRPGVLGMTALERCSQRSTTYWKGNHPAVAHLLLAHAAANK